MGGKEKDPHRCTLPASMRGPMRRKHSMRRDGWWGGGWQRDYVLYLHWQEGGRGERRGVGHEGRRHDPSYNSGTKCAFPSPSPSPPHTNALFPAHLHHPSTLSVPYITSQSVFAAAKLRGRHRPLSRRPRDDIAQTLFRGDRGTTPRPGLRTRPCARRPHALATVTRPYPHCIIAC